MFEPNQKVVCINGYFSPAVAHFYEKLPTEGSTYTVRDIVPGVELNMSETVAVYLQEIQGPLNDHGIERGFHCSRFRELDELTTRNRAKKEDLILV